MTIPADGTASILDRRPAVRVGRRFLPVPAAVLPPVPEVRGLVELPLAPGTPVHAMRSGRIVTAESSSTGEVVIRVEDELRLVYRKLLPSSVAVGSGDTVDAGDIIGVVATPANGALAALQLGVQRPDSSWERVCDVIVGLPDPLELFLTPPVVAQPLRRPPPHAASRRRKSADAPPAKGSPPRKSASAAKLASRRRGRPSSAVPTDTPDGPERDDEPDATNAAPDAIASSPETSEPNEPPADAATAEPPAVPTSPETSEPSEEPADAAGQNDDADRTSNADQTSKASRLSGRRERPRRRT